MGGGFPPPVVRGELVNSKKKIKHLRFVLNLCIVTFVKTARLDCGFDNPTTFKGRIGCANFVHHLSAFTTGWMPANKAVLNKLGYFLESHSCQHPPAGYGGFSLLQKED